MINFTIGAKFENSFLETIDELNKKYQRNNTRIIELFGSFSESVISSARASYLLPKFSQDLLSKYIKKAHSFNIEFNYLLNPSCLGNIEYTSSYRKELLNFVGLLITLGVDKITVTIPFLFEFLKKYYPDLKIVASVICAIDSPEKVLFYQDLGANRIILDYSLNRNFYILEKIREKVNIDLELILNDTCILKCPVRNYHYNFISHLKEDSNISDPYLERCSLRKLQDLSLLIKSPWIRPEDVREYYNIGINHFKIIGRECEKEDLIRTAEAYLSQSYDGNLIDLIRFYLPDEESIKIYVDNKKLQGFIDFFKNNSCNFFCSECKYCEDIANKIVKISEGEREQYISTLEGRIKKYLCI